MGSQPFNRVTDPSSFALLFQKSGRKLVRKLFSGEFHICDDSLHAKGTDIKKVRLYIHSAVTKHPQGSEPPPVLGVRVSCNRLLRPIPG